MQKNTKRNFALDVLRVLACYMVIQVHTGEFYYIGPIGDVIKGENAFWVDLYNSVCRSAVPLFVMLTGYFLLPIKDEPAQFFRKRFTRVVIPLYSGVSLTLSTSSSGDKWTLQPPVRISSKSR